MSESLKRIPSLDGLRMVSILLVVLGHIYGTANYPQNAFTYFLSGFDYFGVQVFFVISGFLITSILLKEHAKNDRINLREFYRRRNLRILPAAFCYITAIALLVHPPDVWYAYTYTTCYVAGTWVLGHLWSLSVEEQFYFVWPVALSLFFASRKKILFVVMLAVPVLRIAFVKLGLVQIEHYFPTVADAIASGCLLACFYPEIKNRFAWLTKPAIFTALIAATLAFPSLLLTLKFRYWLMLGGVTPLLIALCVFACIERRDWILNNRVAHTVGALSYSFYLWQQPFLDHHLPHHWWTAFPANLLLASACATASYYLVEVPFLAMKKNQPKREESAMPVLVTES